MSRQAPTRRRTAPLQQAQGRVGGEDRAHAILKVMALARGTGSQKNCRPNCKFVYEQGGYVADSIEFRPPPLRR